MQTQPEEYQKVDAKRGVDYIGVTVSFVCHDGKGKILLHKRSKNCRDEHERWDCGGGALEFGESFEEGIRREIKEEYCADVRELDFVTVRNVIRPHGESKTHWISIIYLAKVDPGQAKIGEPKKMDDIGWFSPNELPSPLHSQLAAVLDIVQQKGLLPSQ